MSNLDDDYVPGFGVLIPLRVMDAAPLLFFFSLLFLLHHYSTRRQSSLWSHQSRFMSMKDGFQKTVDYTAQKVRGDTPSLNGTVLVASTGPAVSGTYKSVVKFQQIAQFQKPLLPEVPLLECQTELLITRERDAPAGWILSGRRFGELGNWEIEEGYLSPSGQAYWVEHSITDDRILVHGKFTNMTSFRGEWLNSCGERGKFVEFTYIPPQQPTCHREVHVAVPISKSKKSFLR
jgi:hypothetical protein